MPRYLNGNATDVSIEGCRVGAGKTFVTTSNLLAHQIPAGVTKTTETPYWNPIIVSELKEGDSGSVAVTIPETFGINTETGAAMPLTDYYLKLRCTAGKATIKFNDATDGDFGTKLTLASGASDDEVCWYIQDRDVYKVNITFVTSGTKVKVDVMVTK